MALLVILDGAAVPMAEHYRQWRDELAELRFLRVRTGALSARLAAQAEVSGMRCVQELELLQLDAPLPRLPRRAPGVSLRAMLSSDLPTAALLYPGVGMLEFCKLSVGRGHAEIGRASCRERVYCTV
jgi:hypothetical protein